jgi:hypothetical protein
VGSGYGLSKHVTVAPSQIVTLQVAGMKTALPSPVKATQTPLPHTSRWNLRNDQPVPVREGLAALAARPDHLGGTCPQTEIVISEDGASSKFFAVVPVADSIHILTDCDVRAFATSEFAVPRIFGSLGMSSAEYATCQTMATHADGLPISRESPATPGEAVVLYAWGVRIAAPAVKTGDVASGSEALNPASDVQFTFSPNASASKPYGGIFAFPFEFHPRFVGLVPDGAAICSEKPAK